MDINPEDTADNIRQWLSSDSSTDNDVTIDHCLPRIGDEYQVEVPELMTRYDYLCFNQGSGVITYEPLEYEFSRESQINLNDEDRQLRCVYVGTELASVETEGQRLLETKPVADGARMDDYSISSQNKDTDLDCRNNNCCSACSPRANNWKDIELKSFLLGLYTFGKNLYLVRKFVETRSMSDVLTYYYEKFYKSTGYLRWSKSRKMKGGRSIQKDKIYTGCRHHELLSRMFSHVSYDCEISLMKVSKRFREKKLSVEEFVFTLKDMVGISLLVEAVAIGKGKEDLTRTTFHPAKRDGFLITPEKPTGKAWSSLTEEEIIRCLRGDRLVKAQSNELFWEAVWPRLLARGWHSEQNGDCGYVGSMNSLVFLVPGVQKFSKRKLVKGNHYFDSVIDVLNKVAAEPEHLKIESEKVEACADKENCSSDPEVLSTEQHHRYLQLQDSNFNQEKVTIVDTSFVRGEKLVEVRDVKSLPVDTEYLSTISALSSEIEQGTIKESKNEIEVKNTSKHDMESGPCEDKTDFVLNRALYHMPGGLDTNIAAVDNHMDQKTILPNDGPLEKTKSQFEFHQSSYLEPMTKQNGSSACRRGVEANFVSGSPDKFKVQDFQIEGQICTTLAQTDESTKKAVLSTLCKNKEPSTEKSESRTLIDLNYPYLSPESDTDEPVIDNDHSSIKSFSHLSETSNHLELLNFSNDAIGKEQHVVKSRRQSSRKRELTTKALEAIALDFLGPKKKRKCVKSLSRPSSSGKVSEKTGTAKLHINAAGVDVSTYQNEKMEYGDTTLMRSFHYVPTVAGFSGYYRTP